MAKRLTSLRITEYEIEQIEQLRQKLDCNQSELLMLAVDRMYRQEFPERKNPMSYNKEKPMHTTYRIEEEMLGPDATEAEARRMVELLQARGYNVEYGPAIGQDPDTIPAQVWGECLEQL